MSLIKRKTDGFTVIERKGKKMIQSSVFDGKGNLLGENKDNLLYNIDGINDRGEKIDSQKRLEKILRDSQKKIADLLIWTDFKKPAKKLVRLTEANDLYDCLGVSNEFISFGYADNTIIFNTQNILKDLCIDSLSLGGAVADCAAICGNYNNGEIISLSHAGWQGILNGIIEQLIHTYMAELGKKEFEKVQFDFSPMAGINYEWEKDIFDNDILRYIENLKKKYLKLLEEKEEIKSKLDKIQKNISNHHNSTVKKLIEEYKSLQKNTTSTKNELNIFRIHQKFAKIVDEYNIDFEKDKIVEQSKNPKKIIFYIDRLIKRIFLENGAKLEQLNFHKEYTTDLNNTWPSYRIHSLGKNGIINPEHTIKSQDGIVYDSRMGIFNSAFIK